jgi:hypothetical protein
LNSQLIVVIKLFRKERYGFTGVFFSRASVIPYKGTIMPVISVDLAFKRYSDIGIAILNHVGSTIHSQFHKISLPGSPEVGLLTDYLCVLCADNNAAVLIIDGPQAWKDPDNGLEHSRICERQLNTQAKTGLPGYVKPANFTPFVRFSIDLFDALISRGWRLFESITMSPPPNTVIESYPRSAWSSLGISPLPSKKKARQFDIDGRFDSLKNQFRIECSGKPNHDELQALVAGLAGIAIESGMENAIKIYGEPPKLIDGYRREGFIVNPSVPAERRF